MTSNTSSSSKFLFRWFELEERFDTPVLDSFREQLRMAIQAERESLKKRGEVAPTEFDDAEDYDHYMEHLGDEDYEIGEIAELGDQLSIVALYSKGELTIKGMVRRYIPQVDTKKLFMFKELLKAAPFTTAIQHFDAYNELRCINNAIKHSGVVSDELAAFPGWTKGEKLHDIGVAYNRLQPLVKTFIWGFAQECHKRTLAHGPSTT